jgi:radical SAM superfamily enzyme YgiQ (UPF0313 family)
MILLLSCYELGHQPLGLAWPLAFLERAGLSARAVDLATEPFPEALAREARFVALSAPMHTALRLGVKAARRVRLANPGAHVAFHGLYAWLNADYLLDTGLADSVLAGESETALVELAAAVLAGRAKGGRVEPIRARLDYPVPRRDALPPLRRYAHFESGGGSVLAGYVEASRGCKHLCAHCPIVPIYRGRFFAVPVENVMADVRQQVAAGARHISFGDPDFLNGPEHARRVARAFHAEFPELSFDFTAKVEHLLRQRALLPELRENGCAFVVSAVESLSDEVLRRLRKDHKAADVAALVELLDGVGLPLHPTLVAFTPWTTLPDYLGTLEFFRARGLASHVPPIQLAIRLLVPPGSALLEDPANATSFGPLDRERLLHSWSHPDPRMDALHAEVQALVERDEAARAPGRASWEAIRALAHAAAGRAPRDEPMPPPFRPEPPRLSEHWFC